MIDHSVQPGTLHDQHQAALAAAKASPTEHVPRLVASQQVHEQVHGAGAVGRFNNSVAVVITKGVGTMWAAYLFVLLALVSFPQALTSSRAPSETAAAPLND